MSLLIKLIILHSNINNYKFITQIFNKILILNIHDRHL